MIMAFERINYVTKLNKGTSRDEWGNFNYWGYKTPDGKIRARLYEPDDEGYANLTVVKFQLPGGSWRRKITFDDAIHIGTVIVKVNNLDKGFTSDEAMEQVNAIIEIHNDYFDQHVGRKVRVQNYSSRDSEITYNATGYDVTGVQFTMNKDGEVQVNLNTTHNLVDASRVIDYTEDFARSRVTNELNDLQEKIYASQRFLDGLRAAHAKGEKFERSGNSYSPEGLISWNDADKFVLLVNEFVAEQEAVA
jgi:hypothetical protein